MNIHINSCLLASMLFICLVTGQQQTSVAPPAPPAPPAPTPAPVVTNCNSTTTKPTAELNHYNLKTCLVAQFAGYLSIGQGQYVTLENGQVDQNNSHCNESANIQSLVVKFDCAVLEFNIGSSNTTNEHRVFVKSISGKYHIGNNTEVVFSNSTQLFSTTQSGHYYKCNSEQTVEMNKPNISLVLSKFAYEGFRSAAGTDFYQIPEECALDSAPVSDLVRIGVGICLIALVAIVLVAYFIGRRRWSERSSYESV